MSSHCMSKLFEQTLKTITNFVRISLCCQMGLLYIGVIQWDDVWLNNKHQMKGYKYLIILWRHNGREGVSNHQPHECLLNRSFMCRSKKTSKLRVTGLCAGNSPQTSAVNSPVTRKMVPFDVVIMKIMDNAWFFLLWLIPSGAETTTCVFRNNVWSIDHYVWSMPWRDTGNMVLIVQDMQVLVFHEEEFQLPVPLLEWEISF